MIWPFVKHRAALIGLACAALGTLIFALVPPTTHTPHANPQYVEPTWWDGLPALERKYFLAMDFLFWQIESQNPIPTASPPISVPFNSAGAVLLATMSQPGQENMKRNLATFLTDSHRFAYLPHLMPGLAPSISNRDTRLTIASHLVRTCQVAGASPFSPQVIQSLLSSYAGEPDPSVKAKIGIILTLLNVPH